MGGSLVTPCWGSGFLFFPLGKWVRGCYSLGEMVMDYALPFWVVGFMVTPCWERGWVAWLLPAGERVGCMVTSHWGSWFYGYFPLRARMGCMITPRWGTWFYGYSLLGERVQCWTKRMAKIRKSSWT